MIVSQAIRFGRRLALPSKRQILHEMRMLQAEEEHHKEVLASSLMNADHDPAPNTIAGSIEVLGEHCDTQFISAGRQMSKKQDKPKTDPIS